MLSHGTIKAILSSLLLTCGCLLIAGCHTVEGAGRDVQAIGGGVAETADETRPYGEQRRDRQRY